MHTQAGRFLLFQAGAKRALQESKLKGAGKRGGGDEDDERQDMHREAVHLQALLRQLYHVAPNTQVLPHQREHSKVHKHKLSVNRLLPANVRLYLRHSTVFHPFCILILL